MKKPLILGILTLIIILAFLFLAEDNTLQAPEINNESNGISNTMPAPGSSAKEMVVIDESGKEVKEFIVTAKNFTFSPNVITVNKGDKVRIVFKNNEGFHDFVVDEFGAATSSFQAPGEEVLEFTADKTGTFEYYCSVGTHRQMGMKGNLIVN